MQPKDYLGIAVSDRERHQHRIVKLAIKEAQSGLTLKNPFQKFNLKKIDFYRLNNVPTRVVIRKCEFNLKKMTMRDTYNRDTTCDQLTQFLREGVPYRVYRLNIRDFYESFDSAQVIKQIQSIRHLAPQTKKILATLLHHYETSGRSGLPPGMSLTTTISNFLLSDFDNYLKNHEVVYFYSRFIDQLVIITNTNEEPIEFERDANHQLPCGLRFADRHETKKGPWSFSDSTGLKRSDGQELAIDYLGYHFSVSNPKGAKKGSYRLIDINISSKSLSEIKSRIVRAFLEFTKTREADTLIDRIRFLTSNFVVINKTTGVRQMCGIYHSYPRITDHAGLLELDRFLRNIILAKKGRVYSKTTSVLDAKLKRKLLSFRFSDGYKTKRIVRFSRTELANFQRYWNHE